MWAVRFLTGPQMGQSFQLKLGRNLVGRATHCDVKISSHGVSKEHCEIQVYPDKVMVVDLRSSNGTFINGVKIQNGRLRPGDKLGIHDIILDVIDQAQVAPLPQTTGSLALRSSEPTSPTPLSVVPPAASPPAQFYPIQQQIDKFKTYVDEVALPGIYKLPQMMEFRQVLIGLMILLIFSVTLFSMIPMMRITKDSIVSESLRRASSLARTMAQANQQAFLQGQISAMSTHSAEVEEGVKQAFIVQQADGMIVAPASRAGRTTDIPFVNRARKEIKALAEEIDSNTIGASFPIGLYDPNTGEPSVKAYAIVIYDVSALSFDTGRTISLFMQTILIALILGFIVFFFIYQLVEFPLRTLNQKLDLAMREKSNDISISFRFPQLQQLIGNINSLLSRQSSSTIENVGPSLVDKETEAKNLVQMMMLPSATLNAQEQFIACNQRFETFARSTLHQLLGQGLSSIGDSSLQQNIQFLLQKSKENPHLIQSDQLEFSGQPCQIHCQAFCSHHGIDYFVVVITPIEGGV